MGLYGEIGKRVENGKALIAITGSGGKTTLMERLASYFKKEGYSVLITTTTKVASPYIHDYCVDHIYSDDSIFDHEARKGEVVFFANIMDTGKKWMSPSIDAIKALALSYDIVIYEADGSRGLPLKIHSDRDPVIIDNSDIAIAVMGLWGIGEKANQACFGTDSESIVDKQFMDMYLTSADGIMKGLDKAKKSIILFNGGDSVSKSAIDIIASCNIDIDSYIVSIRGDKIYANL